MLRQRLKDGITLQQQNMEDGIPICGSKAADPHRF